MIELFYSRKDHQITPALQEVFKLALKETPTTLEEAISLAQKNFLRPSNKERWELKDGFILWWKKRAFLSLFEGLGMLTPIKPLKKTYDGILLLGADAHDFTHRLSYLLSLKVKAKKVFLLTGERPLTKEEVNHLKSKGITLAHQREDDMIEALFPKEIDHTIVSCANHPDGTRVNTYDTLKKWIDKYATGGKYLIVSNQPFAYYQFLIACKAAQNSPLDISFDIAAPTKLSNKAPVSIGLDSIARILFELEKIKDH